MKDGRRVLFTAKAAELFAALGEDATDALAGGAVKANRLGFSVEAQEEGIHFWGGVKTGAGNKMPTRHGERGL